MTDHSDTRLSFWESRSGLGIAAGSGDVNLKKLEIDALREAIGSPSTILDAGCGNGFTLMNLALDVEDALLFGFDYSSGMIQAAINLVAENNLDNKVSLCQASLLDSFPEALSSLDLPENGFDCIYTERSIINLDTFEQQSQAVQSLWSMLARGGRLILCESFIDGLNEINSFRKKAGLDLIIQPWHNRYLSLSELSGLFPGVCQNPRIVEFSGTYYFISRVIHAKEAHIKGCEPCYESEINKLSLDLPPLPLFGQSKLVIYTKQ